MKISIQQYFNLLKAEMYALANEQVAFNQEKRLKGRYIFLGVRAQLWLKLLRKHTQQYGQITEEESLMDFIDMCMGDDHREMHYIGIEVWQQYMTNGGKCSDGLLQELIATQTSWDTSAWVKKVVERYG